MLSNTELTRARDLCIQFTQDDRKDLIQYTSKGYFRHVKRIQYKFEQILQFALKNSSLHLFVDSDPIQGFLIFLFYYLL